jgi:hypothetical protein
LIDIRLHMSLGDLGTWPEAVEIDRIVLTGVEEQLQGELPPPQVADTTHSGELFSEPVFCPLSKSGVSSPWYHSSPTAALGDLDGDGDLDLVATYSAGEKDEGWLSALNDGKGSFAQPKVYATELSPYLQGGDVDGDGLMELLTNRGAFRHLVLLRNEAGVGWATTQEFDDLYSLGLADADGDGDADLWGIEDPAQQNTLWLFHNDGAGHFDQQRVIGSELHEQGYGAALLVQHLRGGTATGTMWTHPDKPGYWVTYLDEYGEEIVERLAVDLDFAKAPLVRYVGDFDLDGDIDLLTSHEQSIGNLLLFRGLSFRVNSGSGTFEAIDWQDDVVLSNNAEFLDLNADGILDPVFVDSDERDPAVNVNLGVKGGLPVQEGRYPLRGQGGQVLGGDVDRDGDVDLVILERAVDNDGGVHVLLSRLSEGTTAVAEERTTTLPVAPALSPAYPNPFNSSILIPVSLPVDARQVSLVIYDLLGQPVKRLVDGPLSAGAHLVRWDGTDDRGVAQSSGVYVYRLPAGGTAAVGRVVLVR